MSSKFMLFTDEKEQLENAVKEKAQGGVLIEHH
jgi:hypothetical protein